MSRYTLSPQAVWDISETLVYLETQAGKMVADHWEKRLRSTFERLSEFPGQGHRREDLTSLDVRFFPVGRYLVIYRQQSYGIGIVTVLHAARDVSALLPGKE